MLLDKTDSHLNVDGIKPRYTYTGTDFQKVNFSTDSKTVAALLLKEELEENEGFLNNVTIN